jgi:Nitroreductase family
MYRFRALVFFCLTAFAMGLILQREFALLSIMSANLLKNSLQIVERLPLQFRLRSQYKSNGLASAGAISSTIHSPTPRISNPLFPSSTRSFSSTKTAMASSKSFFNAVKDRRSIYALNKESPISDEAIEELVKQTVLHAPSFFNTQSARLVVLLKKEHNVFWDMVKEVLKPIVPEDQFAATEQRLSMFRGGYGTVSLYQPFSFHFTAIAQFEAVRLMTSKYPDPLL